MTCPKSEFSDEFVRLMKNRMEVSFHKYGPVADAYPHKVDAIKSMQKRLQWYLDGDYSKDIAPGNTEYLVDCANFLMIEFMHPAHPDAHFKGTDANGSPGRVWQGGGRATQRANSA